MATVVLDRCNPLDLEERVEAFESEWKRAGLANPAEFLPPASHPSFRSILCELVRVDLELHWTRGQPKRIEDYVRDFPILREDRELLQQVAFEEYRQRLQAGEFVHAGEYAERFDVDAGEEVGAGLGRAVRFAPVARQLAGDCGLEQRPAPSLKALTGALQGGIAVVNLGK